MENHSHFSGEKVWGGGGGEIETTGVGVWREATL